MKQLRIEAGPFALVVALFLAGCGKAQTDPNAGAPPPLKVERADPNHIPGGASRAIPANRGSRNTSVLRN